MDSNDEIWFGYDGKSTPSKKTFLSNVKEGVTPVTIWPHKEVGHTHEANNELKELGLGGLFNNPKPTRLIRRMMELTIDPCEKSIVLDFFAGSATTAQAVLDENRIRGCSTKFIMIQLPEPTQYVKSDGQYKESEAHKAGYKSISEISKERIRRVIKKLQESSHSEFPLESRSEPEDMGFKVFKLVASNFKPWTGVPDNDPNAYAEQMAIYVDPLVDGWKPENVILEAALREGYSLTAKIEQVPGLTRNRIYLVSDPDKGQRFHICLDDSLNPDDIKRLKLTRDDLFICRDSALDDEKAANLALQCRLKTI